MTTRDVQLKLQQQNSRFESRRDIRRGYIVSVEDTVDGDRPGLVWVKALDDNSPAFQVYNPGVIQSPQVGMLVYVERNPKAPARWQLTGYNRDFLFEDQADFEELPDAAIGPHGTEHAMPPGRPGRDPVDVYPHAVVNLAVRPTKPPSMRVRIYPGWYPGPVIWQRFAGPVNSKDFASDVPATPGKAKLVALALDAAGAIQYHYGAEFVDGLPIPAGALPAIPSTQEVLTAITLVNGMTAIENAHFANEIRTLLSGGALASANGRGDILEVQVFGA